MRRLVFESGLMVGEGLDVRLLGLAHADVADFMVQAMSDAGRVGKVLDISY